MSTTIYYFSSTGNSFDIAKVISKEINGVLLPMAACKEHKCQSDVIGFIYPTYFWGIPHIVEDFINTLDIQEKNPYIFAVTLAQTSGGGLGSMNQLLKKKGFRLAYGQMIHSVSNYIVEYDINQKTIEKLTMGARKRAYIVAKDILMKKQNDCKKIPILTDLFHSIYAKRSGDGDRNFHILNSCTGCGLCETLCPADNIQMANGRPEFQHHCEHCIACVHWCPKEAVQYGNKTLNHSRYHHPGIKQL